MAIKIDQKNSKEIIALNTYEAVRLRPTMYVGQVSPIEEKLPLVIDGKLLSMEKMWSAGFMHLIVEILENALDEAKRCKGKMKNVTVKVNLDTNEITVIDEGLGFHNAAKKHSKTKKNVVRTALEELHAGSNFTDTSTNLIGTHGIGSAVTNILSEYFTIETVNKTHYVRFHWDNFKVTDEEIRRKNPSDKMGTKITFIPSKEIFPNYKWDIDLITTYLSFKYFLIKNDPIINKLELRGYFIKDNKLWDIDITTNFIPKDHIVVTNNVGTIYLWEGYENSCSLSFVNGSQCTGIHQKVVNDWCNEYFKYEKAHHFYETLISLNVPSTLMRFADQNKTKFATGRNEIEEMMKDSYYNKLIRFLSKSEIARNIEKSIEDRLHSENIGKIRKAQKQSKRKISDKFSPASKYKGSIYLVEGECLEENTKIFIIRKNKILYIKLKNVKIGDLVITHNNSLKPINCINKSIKNTIQIKTTIGNILCSEKHKWFIYNTETKCFYFEETKNLDKNKHKLVKNYLSLLESFDEIIKIDSNNEKIKITNDKNEDWSISKNMNICVFDTIINQFIMKKSNMLKTGDILSKILMH
jgi:hypothetical protein